MQTSKDSVLGAEAGGSKEAPHPECGRSQRGPTPVHPPNTAFECQGSDPELQSLKTLPSARTQRLGTPRTSALPGGMWSHGWTVPCAVLRCEHCDWTPQDRVCPLSPGAGTASLNKHFRLKSCPSSRFHSPRCHSPRLKILVCF